ncbi:unnamed protein product [Cyclocybe aegerita]|uniref:Uncharacterized protein n=1 Tax=Cyclocybe aegerita TaxID=1973307 RepID=A0A8S0WIB6_CYCAE|nr:unnamed protein product [Cyclocybe aegerita]
MRPFSPPLYLSPPRPIALAALFLRPTTPQQRAHSAPAPPDLEHSRCISRPLPSPAVLIAIPPKIQIHQQSPANHFARRLPRPAFSSSTLAHAHAHTQHADSGETLTPSLLFHPRVSLRPPPASPKAQPASRTENPPTVPTPSSPEHIQ